MSLTGNIHSKQYLEGEGFPRGNDGISPTVEVTENENGHHVAITDVYGTKAFDVRHGKDGDPGYTPQKGIDYFDGYTPVKGVDYNDGYTPQKNVDYFDGEKGDPGYTPVKGKDYSDGKDGVSATHSWNGTTLTVKSASGTSSADLKGDKGDAFTYEDFTAAQLAALKGKDGKDGKTPIKGVDYTDGLDGVNVVDITSGRPTPTPDGDYGSYLSIKTARPDGTDEKSYSFWVQHGRDGAKGDKGDKPNVFSSTYTTTKSTPGGEHFIPSSTVDTTAKDVNAGDLIVTQEGKLYLSHSTSAYGAAQVKCELLADLNGKDGVKTVNGQSPDANGNVEIEAVGGVGVSSWEDLSAPIPNEYLPNGYPHYEHGVLLVETGAIEQTNQTFGKIWVIGEVPKVELGKTYEIKYNGVGYNCLCMADPSNSTGDPDAVCFGNLSVVGGENTGEPFIILVSPEFGMTMALDLVGSTSVSIGIEGDVIVPFEEKYLPGSIYTVVFDILKDNTTWQAKADKNFREILEKAKDPSSLVRAFVRTHAMSIYYGSLDVLFYSYGELTYALNNELNFAIKENSANNLYLKMTSDGITVSR